MFDIAFGLLFFNILHTLAGIMFVLFVISPIILNMITHEGYWVCCGHIWHGLKCVFRRAFGKKSST